MVKIDPLPVDALSSSLMPLSLVPAPEIGLLLGIAVVGGALGAAIFHWGLPLLLAGWEQGRVRFLPRVSPSPGTASQATLGRCSDILDNTLACIVRYRFFPSTNTWVYDFWSAGAEAVFGFTAAEFMADIYLWISRIPSEDIVAAVKPAQQQIAQGQSYRKEYRFRHKDGTWRWIASAATSQWSATDSCWIVTVIDTDISDRKALESALKASQSRLSGILNTAQAAISTLCVAANGTWNYEYFSQGSQEIFGFAPATLTADSQFWLSRVHPEDRSRVVAEYLQTPVEPSELEYRFLHADGTWRWLNTARSGQWDASSDAWVITAVTFDVSSRRRAKENLKLYERVVAATQDGVALVDKNYIFQIANQTFLDYFACTRDRLIGESMQGLFGEEAFGRMRSQLERCLAGQSLQIEFWHSYPGKGQRYVGATLSPCWSGDEAVWGIVGSLHDLTELKLAEEALRRSEERYRLVAENMSDLVCLHRPDGVYLYVTPSCRPLLGYEPEELVGQHPHDYFHPQDCKSTFYDGYDQGEIDMLVPVTHRMRHKQGHYVWLETLIKPILDAQGQLIQLQTTSRDVSEKIEIHRRLEHDAIHDNLTGLPNRSLLMERLDLAIDRRRRHPEFCYAVLFLDLDRFKVINDSLGHHVGDDLLIGMAELLRCHLRAHDLAARLGGDEFVVLLEDITDGQEAAQVAQRILSSLKKPFVLNNREVFVSSSIGIALGDSCYNHGAEVLRDADIAMYRAKGEGKSRFTLFNPEMHVQIINEMNLENDLRRALENQEFYLVYQPIVCLQDGRIQGLEGLVRWQHPQRGLMSPEEFIPLAEETGAIVGLGAWVLRQACQQLSHWQQRFPQAKALNINVNLSAQQLRDPHFAVRVEQILSATRLRPHQLELEVTESVLLADVELILANLHAMRARGVRLSVDDFGTGYSSLSYLHRFPFSSIKVDQAFIKGMALNTQSANIVNSILALANSLNLDVVAEGVESMGEVTYLHQLECKLAQGYYFSRPLLPSQIEELLVHQRPSFQVEHLGRCSSI